MRGRNDDKRITVEAGGPGFSPFGVSLRQAGRESMILTEFVRYEGEMLELDWHLVKLNDRDASVFFDEKKNRWMQKPASAETSAALKQKLVMMLDYYAAYYLFIKDRSSYFIPGRVVLPFQFYQHAVGLKPLKRCQDFRNLFLIRCRRQKRMDILRMVCATWQENFQRVMKTAMCMSMHCI